MGSGMHGPDPEKVKAVNEILTPKTKSDLRKILGFFSYFRSYIPNYAHIAQPLTELTTNRYNAVLPWGTIHTRPLMPYNCLRVNSVKSLNFTLFNTTNPLAWQRMRVKLPWGVVCSSGKRMG